MSEMLERVAEALFKSRYPHAFDEGFWPDRLDETVNGPPFNADGYREMARAAIEAMQPDLEEAYNKGIQDALASEMER